MAFNICLLFYFIISIFNGLRRVLGYPRKQDINWTLGSSC